MGLLKSALIIYMVLGRPFGRPFSYRVWFGTMVAWDTCWWFSIGSERADGLVSEAEKPT